MLLRLAINDFALIRELDLEITAGLTIISGETGAGKSIFLDAISFISGQRASREMVRYGARRASVSALFYSVYNLFPEELIERLNLASEDLQSGQLLLYREIDTNGRSVAKINGQLANITTLRELGAYLFAIHAQHEQVSLFSTQKQRELLDRFAGANLERELALWQNYRNSRIDGARKLKELGINPAERERRLDLLKFQLEEIEANNLPENALSTLQEKHRELAAVDNIKNSLAKSLVFLDSEQEYSSINFLDQALMQLNKVSQDSKVVSILYQNLESARITLQEQIRIIKEEMFQLENSEDTLASVQSKLSNWDILSRKYGDSWEEVQEFYHSAQEEKSRLESSTELFVQLRKQLMQEEAEAGEVAERIHILRSRAAKELAYRIEDSLTELNMPQTNFEIRVEQAKQGDQNYWAKEGRDNVSFYISTNVGEELMPLEKIASGGEASRILLAIKSILAELDSIPILIFDEIDSGISGDTAAKLGMKLKDLSNHSQVVAVTHTAQIAAMADRHLFLFKEIHEGRTETRYHDLQGTNRQRELARLLVGSEEDLEALELASKLLHQYNS